MSKSDIQLMAEHWDARAQEDCYYYVAYEQRDHGDAFWNSGRDIASYIADCFDKWNPPDPWGVASMASMYISGLAVDDCDMNYLRAMIDDQLAKTIFFSPADYPGIRQINFVIPPTLTPDGHRVEVVFSSPTSEWQVAIATDIAPPPAESLDWLWLSDGREVSRQWHVICDVIKVQVRGIRSPADVTLEASYGAVLSSSGIIVISERLGWYEMNFDCPDAPPGQHQMRLHHPATGDTEWKTVEIGK